MFVDDDATVLTVLTEALQDGGYTVIPCASGLAALELLQNGQAVDLLISDLAMPEMDGLTLVREVQRERPGLPVILLTGYASDATGIAMSRMLKGAYALLRKPISGRTLAERVAIMLETASRA